MTGTEFITSSTSPPSIESILSFCFPQRSQRRKARGEHRVFKKFSVISVIFSRSVISAGNPSGKKYHIKSKEIRYNPGIKRVGAPRPPTVRASADKPPASRGEKYFAPTSRAVMKKNVAFFRCRLGIR